MTEAQIIQLQKEIARLKRREKILTNRVRRLHEENERLASELDSAEKTEKKAKRVPADACPSCGGTLEITDIGHAILTVCLSKNCSFKKTKKY